MERGLGTGSDRPCFPFSKTGQNVSSCWIECPAEGLASQVSCLSSSLLCLLALKGRQDSGLQMNTEWFHNLKN